MLKVSGVTKYYGSEKVLDGVGLGLKREQIQAFLGPNGAGKTTTFKIIAGVERPTAGSISLDGLDLKGLPIHIRAQKGLTFLPQETSLFRGLTVQENVRIYLKEGAAPGKSKTKVASESLEQLNILELKNKGATNLSAGQKRKVEVARALVLSPVYLMLDEPFSDLDPRSVAEIKEILVSLKKDEGIGILLSDHRANEALSIADHNHLIKDGRIIARGSSEEIVESKEAKEFYFAVVD
ncbi:ATP-binding cassette domain-containing protein [Candidatus Bipolaricaulota bacterium]|nr:ATP-binding cassette domain-containing protein [Candidatus Bipolaricaulota bacterium]